MPTQEIRVFVVDAFACHAFAGNPAGVCVLNNDISSTLKQKIAAELGKPATAFVVPLSPGGLEVGGGDRFGISWHSPVTELPLCGHGTVAAAAVIFEKFGKRRKVTLETKRGVSLMAAPVGDGDRIELRFPTLPPSQDCQQDSSITALLEGALGRAVAADVEEVRLHPGTGKLVARMADGFGRAQLENLEIDQEKLLSADTGGRVKSLIVTTKSTGPEFDFLSRNFVPWSGIPEDAVTGSAHAVLAPLWSALLDKTLMRARQCSARGGDLGSVSLTFDSKMPDFPKLI